MRGGWYQGRYFSVPSSPAVDLAVEKKKTGNVCKTIVKNKESGRILAYFYLDCLFDSLRPTNNLSVIKGRVFLGWTSTKLRLMCLAHGPQCSDACEARTRGPSVSSQALCHWATALPIFLPDSSQNSKENTAKALKYLFSYTEHLHTKWRQRQTFRHHNVTTTTLQRHSRTQRFR